MSRAREGGAHVLLLFVDGVGVGSRDPAVNPFARSTGSLLGRFDDEIRLGDPLPLSPGGFWKPVDASLGVPGLPQSATGQATILTGVNAPARVGAHVSAIPTRRVRELLEEGTIFSRLARAGRRATFANAYTQAFFERKRPHISATTRSMLAAGLPFRRIEDLVAGKALFHDYTNRVLPYGAASLPARSADEAAEILLGLAREHDFTLHEHFLTDLAGHRGSDDERTQAARRIEALVASISARADREGVLFLVVSDHGNLEDATVRTHTKNPVPFLAWGPGAEEALAQATDLTHVAPAILSALGL